MNKPFDRVAIFSDIHGNLPALEAALDDIRRRGIGTIICLGDLVGKGPSGAEVVDICRKVCDSTVLGNWDAMVAGTHDHPVNVWHRSQLGSARLAYLRELPAVTDLLLSGRVVRLFHASQQGIFHRVHQYGSREAHLAMFDNTAFTGNDSWPDIVGYGDIHIGYLKSFENKCLFNAGSVGNPLDITEACYAVLEGQVGSTSPGPWTISLVRVPYDIEESIRQAERSGMPDIEAYKTELRTARYRGLPAPA